MSIFNLTFYVSIIAWRTPNAVRYDQTTSDACRIPSPHSARMFYPTIHLCLSDGHTLKPPPYAALFAFHSKHGRHPIPFLLRLDGPVQRHTPTVIMTSSSSSSRVVLTHPFLRLSPSLLLHLTVILLSSSFFFRLSLAQPGPPSSTYGCTAQFDPVCCRTSLNPLVVKTTSNSCQCTRISNGVVLRSGACNNPGTCICPAVFMPVCCRLPSGALETTGNACLCRCENGAVVRENGECPVVQSMSPSPSMSMMSVSRPCACTLIFLPVCCKTGMKSFERRPNACTCECDAGNKVVRDAKCNNTPSASPSSTALPSIDQSSDNDGCPCRSTTTGQDKVCCKSSNSCFKLMGSACKCGSPYCEGGAGQVVAKRKCSREQTCLRDCKKRTKKNRVCCAAGRGGTFVSRNGCACERCHRGVVVKTTKTKTGRICPVCFCPRLLNPVMCKVGGKEGGRRVRRANVCLCTCLGGTVTGAAVDRRGTGMQG